MHLVPARWLGLPNFISSLYNNLMWSSVFHFTGEKTEVRKSKVTCQQYTLHRQLPRRNAMVSLTLIPVFGVRKPRKARKGSGHSLGHQLSRYLNIILISCLAKNSEPWLKFFPTNEPKEKKSLTSWNKIKTCDFFQSA